jgi:hypothetical protein
VGEWDHLREGCRRPPCAEGHTGVGGAVTKALLKHQEGEDLVGQRAFAVCAVQHICHHMRLCALSRSHVDVFLFHVTSATYCINWAALVWIRIIG